MPEKWPFSGVSQLERFFDYVAGAQCDRLDGVGKGGVVRTCDADVVVGPALDELMIA